MRTLTLMAASLLLAACNTTPREPLVGADRDEHGCIGSAGYQWSALAGQCVRLFEQGIRLNPIDAGQTVSAFVLFNADQTLLVWLASVGLSRIPSSNRRTHLPVSADH